MENIYIIAHYIADRSHYWIGDSLEECINFIRYKSTAPHSCLYRWHVRIYDNASEKCLYTGNLGKYIFG